MHLIYDPPPTRYFNKSSALQEIPNTHIHLIPFIIPLAPLLKVDILTNLPVQDGSVILSTYQMASVLPLKMSVALLMKKNKLGKWHQNERAQQNVKNVTVNCCWLSLRVDKWVAIYEIFLFPATASRTSVCDLWRNVVTNIYSYALYGV